MPTFAELKARYLSSSGVTTYTGCDVQPLIFDAANHKEYFPALRDAINAAGVQFVYLAGWWLDPTFSLDGAGAGTTLVDLLKAKSAAGVDVRVLGWVMPPEVLRHPQVQRIAGDMLNLNSETMAFVNRLRAEPTLAAKACLNILSHPAGAVHTKMAIVGGGSSSVGFTGGIDLQAFRQSPVWHDVQAKVAGPAVQGFFDTFRLMWNEVRSRPPATGLQATGQRFGTVTCDSHTAAMPDLPARSVSTTSTGTMHVQSVRTFPQFHLAASSGGSMTSMPLPGNAPLSFAPSGATEIRDAWKKGIDGADTYIYAEDQAFTSNEVCDWINARMKASPNLKVIFVMGGNDPTAPNPPPLIRAMNVAVNAHLLAGLSAAQIDRIGIFLYRSPPPAGPIVHTKSTIVDDNWAIVGSANFMRRSLYTDVEHSVAYMDEAGTGVPSYRAKLWARHLGTSIPDLTTALNRWFAIPFQGSSGNPLPLDRIRLAAGGSTALPVTSLTSDEQIMIDELMDHDSRQTWGAQIVPLFLRMNGGGVLSGAGAGRSGS